MDSSSDDAAWSMASFFMPSSSLLVRFISFSCLGLGLIVSLPFVLLIVLDVFLWIWRTIWDDPPTRHGQLVEAQAADSSSTISSATGAAVLNESIPRQRTHS